MDEKNSIFTDDGKKQPRLLKEVSKKSKPSKEINTFKDDEGNVKVIKYCPYCSNLLIENNGALYCEHCDEEISYASNSNEVNSDFFENLLLERKGRRYGIYMLIPAGIGTALSIFFIIFTLISSSDTGGTSSIPVSTIIGSTLLGYNGVIICVLVLIISSIFNYKAKKLGYRSIPTALAAFFVSMIGTGFGLTFTLMILVRAITG